MCISKFQRRNSMDKNFVQNQIEALQAKIGDKKVLLGLSGGVDSSVCAALIHKACPNNLVCVFVNHGLLRKGEFEQVVETFKGRFGMNLIAVDAEKRFLDKLKGVSNPEQKRKIIGEEFIRVFEEEAKKLGKIEFLAQGTILPDIIESGTDGKNKLVKSHHNVGGLPKDIGFEGIIEPVRDLYKFEVREVGRELGLPDFIVDRQPFPGPGLGVRVIGEITKEKLDILRDADYIFREEVEKAGWGNKIWQYFAVINNSMSVGVDATGGRSYENLIALRAVNTHDAVVADWVEIPYDILRAASSRIVKEVKGVNRVVYDITTKPPATIEWE
ncbi:MAG: glutamine-hydrolyzing GMP synthase [Clostridia bacterium]